MILISETWGVNCNLHPYTAPAQLGYSNYHWGVFIRLLLYIYCEVFWCHWNSHTAGLWLWSITGHILYFIIDQNMNEFINKILPHYSIITAKGKVWGKRKMHSVNDMNALVLNAVTVTAVTRTFSGIYGFLLFRNKPYCYHSSDSSRW